MAPARHDALRLPTGILFLAVVLGGCRRATEPGLVIANVTVYDGSGAPGFPASVRIVGDRIEAVGEVRSRETDWFVDGTGLALAPGFIDTHSHADRGIFEERGALAAVSQGITTVVVGQDGGSPYPLAEYFGRLDSTPAAVNVASLAGHGTLRELVMGEDTHRTATAAEVDSMGALLRQELGAGALGLSTGLEYEPGIYSSYEEVVSLARLAADSGGGYVSHIRSEDRAFWEAVDEIIRIGRDARLPVHISHLKLAMRSLWGLGDSLIAVLDRARASGVELTADVYPYTAWQSSLTVLFPERDYSDREAARFALREVAQPDDLVISRFDPESSYVGRTLEEIASRRRSDPATTLFALIREAEAMETRTGQSAESVIGISMSEQDVERLLAWPWANVCTDGELAGRHPRGFGAFPRVLGRHVRERSRLTMEDAIHRMTGLPALTMGFSDRGVIAPGQYADLVLFDPATVLDQATMEEPRKPAVGIRSVWVNGQAVYEQGGTTGAFPGRVLRRTDRRSIVRP
ncbi:MAG TPA: D-aminoacylase [Gemmatimonadales bacterium]